MKQDGALVFLILFSFQMSGDGLRSRVARTIRKQYFYVLLVLLRNIWGGTHRRELPWQPDAGTCQKQRDQR